MVFRILLSFLAAYTLIGGVYFFASRAESILRAFERLIDWSLEIALWPLLIWREIKPHVRIVRPPVHEIPTPEYLQAVKEIREYRERRGHAK